MDNELRDGINRILFHIQSNEERADKIAELIAPELADAEKWRKVWEIAKQHTHGECRTCKVSDHCHDFGTSLCWSARQVAESIEVKKATPPPESDEPYYKNARDSCSMFRSCGRKTR